MIIHVGYAAPSLGGASILRDRKSIYVLGNTRLFRPVLPWSITDDRPKPIQTHTGYRTMYGSRSNFISGEQRQLKGSGIEGTLVVNDPDSENVYELPLTVFLFDPKSRWSATAPDHVVIFTSNGQVQAHWGSVETRNKTAEAGRTISGLRRLAQDVLFTEVGLDRLPPHLRSRVVSADRTRFTDVPLARAIQSETARWLAEQPELQELEKELSRERSRSTGRAQVKSKTLDEIAKRLGFRGSWTPPPRPPTPPKPPPVLLDEPTELSGNETISLVLGKTRTAHFSLNAHDGFLAEKAVEVELRAEGLSFAADPIPSSLRRGRFSMELLISDDENVGMYSGLLTAGFLARAGSLKTLEWPFKLKVLTAPVDPTPPPDRKHAGHRPIVEWVENDSKTVGDVNDGSPAQSWLRSIADPSTSILVTSGSP